MYSTVWCQSSLQAWCLYLHLHCRHATWISNKTDVLLLSSARVKSSHEATVDHILSVPSTFSFCTTFVHIFIQVKYCIDKRFGSLFTGKNKKIKLAWQRDSNPSQYIALNNSVTKNTVRSKKFRWKNKQDGV